MLWEIVTGMTDSVTHQVPVYISKERMSHNVGKTCLRMTTQTLLRVLRHKQKAKQLKFLAVKLFCELIVLYVWTLSPRMKGVRNYLKTFSIFSGTLEITIIPWYFEYYNGAWVMGRELWGKAGEWGKHVGDDKSLLEILVLNMCL